MTNTTTKPRMGRPCKPEGTTLVVLQGIHLKPATMRWIRDNAEEQGISAFVRDLLERIQAANTNAEDT